MEHPLVGVIMGSDSDWPVMQRAVDVLRDFDVPHEARVLSAHRTPDLATSYAEEAEERGLRCIIAGAGGAAHLAGVLASKTTLPVLGVPMPSRHLQGLDSLLSTVQMPQGLDSLLSTVQMPGGIPVATFAIGEAGAKNAALFAIAILAATSADVRARLVAFRRQQAEKVASIVLPESD
jgi:5-(carboxyamino)imidazole ribonucleotide mutase